MSYKVSLLAFAAEVPDDVIIGELATTIDTISGDVAFDEAFALLEERGPVKFASVLATGRSARSGACRGTLMDMFSYTEFATAFLGHDDQQGIHLFDFCHPAAKRWLRLVSDGPLLGGDVDEVSVAYPQKDFASEELDRLNALPDTELSDAQYEALSAYHSAIDIGLRECFDWRGGRDYLQLFHGAQAIELRGQRRRVAFPNQAVPLFAYWPSHEDLATAGIDPR